MSDLIVLVRQLLPSRLAARRRALAGELDAFAGNLRLRAIRQGGSGARPLVRAARAMEAAAAVIA
jgi:hypothetical protein